MLACMVLVGAPGCNLIFPDISHEPIVHNPFPQLNKVAVAPFFNQSNEPTVDGRKFALAYFAELQAVPGFEVVPLGVVETAIIENQVNLANPGEARRTIRRTTRRAAACGSNGTRQTLVSTRFRLDTACLGALRKKNTSPRHLCSSLNSHSPRRSSKRNRRYAKSCRLIHQHVQLMLNRRHKPSRPTVCLCHRLLKTARKVKTEIYRMRRPRTRRRPSPHRRKKPIAKMRTPVARSTKKLLPSKNCLPATAPQTACPHR